MQGANESKFNRMFYFKQWRYNKNNRMAGVNSNRMRQINNKISRRVITLETRERRGLCNWGSTCKQGGKMRGDSELGSGSKVSANKLNYDLRNINQSVFCLFTDKIKTINNRGREVLTYT